MSIGCLGHQFSLQKRETVILNMEASQAAQYEQQKWVTSFKSLGIKRQEGYMQEGNRIQRLVTYAATVPSAERAKRLIKKITMRLPEFIDDDDRQVLDNVIDSTVAEARQKRALDTETAVEIQVNYYPVQFSLIIQQ